MLVSFFSFYLFQLPTTHTCCVFSDVIIHLDSGCFCRCRLWSLELETLLALLTQNSDEAPTQELHFQLLDDVGHQSNIYKAGVYLQFKDIDIGHSCLWSTQDQDMETLRRKLSVSIKQRTGGERPDNKGREETTTNCNQEFDFVNFDAADRVDSVDSEVDTMMTMEHCPSLSSGESAAECNQHQPGVQSKRGTLWLMTGQFFFETWQEKFCVLTENSFYSFSKSLGSSKSKKSFTKICLLDISDMDLVTHKGRTVVTIQTPSTGKLMLMKQGWRGEVVSTDQRKS